MSYEKLEDIQLVKSGRPNEIQIIALVILSVCHYRSLVQNVSYIVQQRMII